MTLCKMHDAAANYQSLTLDIDDFLDLLDPHIGEAAAMQLSKTNHAIKDHWTPLELKYFPNEGAVAQADISVWRSGVLLMNHKAFLALRKLLNPYGEFLSCTLRESPAYFFNCLNVKPADEADVQYRMHQGIFAEVESIEFSAEEGDHIFKHENAIGIALYCSQAFAEVFEQAELKGLAFTKNLAASIPA